MCMCPNFVGVHSCGVVMFSVNVSLQNGNDSFWSVPRTLCVCVHKKLSTSFFHFCSAVVEEWKWQHTFECLEFCRKNDSLFFFLPNQNISRFNICDIRNKKYKIKWNHTIKTLFLSAIVAYGKTIFLIAISKATKFLFLFFSFDYLQYEEKMVLSSV